MKNLFMADIWLKDNCQDEKGHLGLQIFINLCDFGYYLAKESFRSVCLNFYRL